MLIALLVLAAISGGALLYRARRQKGQKGAKRAAGSSSTASSAKAG